MNVRKYFLNSLVVLLLSSTQVTQAQTIDLGTYPGGTWAEMWYVSNSGIAVGFGDDSVGNTRAVGVFMRGPDAPEWFDIGTLGGQTFAMCMAVADNGLVVGHGLTAEGKMHGFVWSRQAGLIDLGTLEGHTQSAAYGVNKSGTLIVGWSGVEEWDKEMRPVVWTRSGPTGKWFIRELDTQGLGQLVARPWKVNNNGQIVGSGWDDAGQFLVGILWNPIAGTGWKPIRLESSATYLHSETSGINEAGEIVGGLYTSDWSEAFPALWKPDTASTWILTVLPTLSGLMQGWNWAYGINDAGEIVGVSNDADWYSLATRWSAKDPGLVHVLGFPGNSNVAMHVNNGGVAVGGYSVSGSPERAVVLKFR